MVGALIPRLMSRVFLWMSIALLLSAMTSFFVATRTGFSLLVEECPYVMYLLCFGELAFVVMLTFFLRKMSLPVAVGVFILYSVLNGLTLSVIFLSYSPLAIGKGLAMTACLFMSMALVGYVTKRDLSRYSSLLISCLLGLLFATVANLFIGSGFLDYVLSWVGIVLFMALTAWDMSMIKVMLLEAGDREEELGRVALLGALNLYLDFVNLFLHIMRLSSKR